MSPSPKNTPPPSHTRHTTRRDFVKAGVGVLAAAGLAGCAAAPASKEAITPTNPTTPPAPRVEVPNPREEPPTPTGTRTKVFVLETKDRRQGIPALLGLAGLGFVKGREVVIKPNLVSTNSFPATTHNDTLEAVVAEVKKAGGGKITIAESAGLGRTKSVIKALNTEQFCEDLGTSFVNFDDLDQKQWETFSFDGMYWNGELALPKLIRDPDKALIWLPCCKTHSMGGHFTMSMKLAVGITPVDRRGDLHSAGQIPYWVADINAGFKPDLVMMDAIQCFIDGGPTSGTVADAGLLVASTDRVALDAVGVAILKAKGCNTAPIRRKIFEQEQITRAVELKLGVSSPDEIELVGEGTAIKQLQSILDIG